MGEEEGGLGSGAPPAAPLIEKYRAVTAAEEEDKIATTPLSRQRGSCRAQAPRTDSPSIFIFVSSSNRSALPCPVP